MLAADVHQRASTIVTGPSLARSGDVLSAHHLLQRNWGKIMPTREAVCIWSAQLILLVSLGSAAAQSPSTENGADVFKKCRACHLVGDTAKHAVGPALNNVIGRKAGTSEGYTFSDNMRELGEGGLIWSEAELNRYLENPKAVVPRGKMAFPGIADPQDRADVIAYLKTFSKP